jgi:hypothetical protein
MQGYRWGWAGVVGDRGCSTQVIEMGVGQPDTANPPATAPGFVQDHLPVPGGVNNRRLASVWLADQVSIGLDRSENESDYFKHRLQVELIRDNI